MSIGSDKIRSQAASSLQQIAFGGRSANDFLANVSFENPADTSLYKSLVLNACRYFVRLEQAAKSLMQKHLRAKDQDLFCLIIIGLYQLEYSRVPEHAAISETVEACEKLKKPWAKKLVNGVLRNYSRQADTIREQLDKNWDSKFSFPDWLINKIKPHYKGKVEGILEASNQQAPLSLRVNLSKTSRQDYLASLDETGISAEPHPLVESAIVLNEPLNVTLLPNFDKGWISVQDPAAQLSAWILKPQVGMTILDACAAPGGKTAHLLEYADNKIDLTSVDIDDSRCERIEENLQRLQLKADVICHDAIEFMAEHNKVYDQILLDVPCSATGVIRRHPDIKLLRRDSDIAELVTIQQQMLNNAWGALKPNGQLLYATCSILPQENSQQIAQFLEQQPNAKVIPFSEAIQSLSNSEIGCQILPNQQQMDGFYYCLLTKTV